MDDVSSTRYKRYAYLYFKKYIKSGSTGRRCITLTDRFTLTEPYENSTTGTAYKYIEGIKLVKRFFYQ
ncbi:hypothetical protein CBW18_04845 [Pedobacter sp. AJM]|nr:hypothetical protein CBW18_04845 [Pedobacter sp. AJM]